MNRQAALLLLALLLTACGPDEALEVGVPSWAKVAPEQIAEARKHGVPVAFENDLGMRFVLVPAGTFLMGSPEDEVGREKYEVQHEVTVSRPYYMQIAEVTNTQYRSLYPSHDSGSFRGHAYNGEKQPVVDVRWSDASAYAEGLAERDTLRTYRLPTEAEWEYACRAGTTTMFSHGNSHEDLPKYANFSDKNDDSDMSHESLDDGHSVSAPVMAYLPNGWGLYDMHGNVSEWCSDWVSYYTVDPATDPSGPASGHTRVIRGGCFLSTLWFCRAAWRWEGTPDYRSGATGFRLVSPLPEPGE